MGEDRDLSGSDLSSEQGGVFAHPLPPDLWVTNGEQQKKKRNKTLRQLWTGSSLFVILA